MPSCYPGQFVPAGSTTARLTCRGSSSHKFANGVDGRSSLCRPARLPLDDFRRNPCIFRDFRLSIRRASTFGIMRRASLHPRPLTE